MVPTPFRTGRSSSVAIQEHTMQIDFATLADRAGTLDSTISLPRLPATTGMGGLVPVS